MQPQRIVKRAIPVARNAQDVSRQTAVSCAYFDEIAIWNLECGIENAGHLGELDFEELAEERADVDAGKKIARATGSLVGAGVVAELGMVEREVHERGHRHRAAFADGSEKGFGRALLLLHRNEDLLLIPPDAQLGEVVRLHPIELALGVARSR